ncbi:hypothetical protein [Actinoplanes sp. L3-i22]|uniref:hypothetical protein n=1 Tax=Actinoplanes sp. L3-i22 TaxID=2836373 RepID=UPI001C76136B|nr:hypothetical protein [Actinoplanes sp. L3-i22]BCY09277.1 peptidase [Actinoplanes sp. L3-i22]
MTISRRAFLAAGTGGALAVLGPAAAAAPAAAAEATHLRRVTAYTQVYGDGQKLTHLVLTYDAEIAGRPLTTATFQVPGRTVTGVWTADRPGIDPGQRRGSGRYVVLELSLDDTAAKLWVSLPGTGGTGGPPTVGDTTPSHQVLPASATVVQAATVHTTHGAAYPASATAVPNTATENLIVDDFRQLTFTDEVTGLSLPYNLFVPRGYDPRRSYPLVLFMHDASVVAGGHLSPLAQGTGATVWASPADQARHECFVLAPAYPAIVVDDTYLPSAYFETTVNLVNRLTEQYRIDRRRLHATGQSMGAMLSLGMNIRHPDLFASSYIVAGQWPAEQADPLAAAKMWVCVSQGDTKAYPGISAIVARIAPLGAEVATATWNGAGTDAEFRAAVAALRAEHAGFNFASFTPGTVPGATIGNGGSEHTGTWRVAYDIPGIRDWILRQSR